MEGGNLLVGAQRQSGTSRAGVDLPVQWNGLLEGSAKATTREALSSIRASPCGSCTQML